MNTFLGLGLGHNNKRITISANVNINALFFADDGALLALNNNDARYLLRICERWSRYYGLVFSPTKCAVLVKAIINDNLTLYNETLPEVTNFNYLGIDINRNGINTDACVEKRSRNARSKIFWLKSVGMNSYGWRTGSAVRVYKTFVRPMMEYGLALLIYPEKYIQLLQKIQNIALRIIAGGSRSTSISALHTLLAVEYMKDRNEVLNMKYFSNIITNKHQQLVWHIVSDTVDLIQRNKHVPAKSLIKQFIQKNRWGKLLVDDPGSFPDDKELLVLRLQTLQQRQEAGTNAAHLLPPISHYRGYKIVLDSRNIDRSRMRALLHWKLGRFSNGQPCSQCGIMNSPSHAIRCSKAYLKLIRLCRRYKYQRVIQTRFGTMNIVDSMLWQIESKKSLYWKVIAEVSDIIINMQILILGYQATTAVTYSDDEDPNEKLNQDLRKAFSKSTKSRRQTR